MKYTLVNGVARFETNDVSILEQMLLQEPRPETARIEFDLPTPLEAMVRRVGKFVEEVFLSNGTSMRTLTRHSLRNPEGQLGVSCNPDGTEVDVETINVPFRDYNDALTDRGHVWIAPGEPAVAWFELKPQQFSESNESFADVIAAAEAAVHSKVLKHFLH
jgi:hypothetical protein